MHGSLYDVLAPVLIAASGDDGHAWAAVLRRAPQAQLLAVLDLAASGVEGIDEALTAHPEAAVAVWARGPREATRIAERLVAHPGPTLLHPAPSRPPSGTGIQLTHAWLSLAGIGALERLFGASSRGVEAVRLTVKGLPEGRSPGLVPSLYHAATVVNRIGRDVRVERAVLASEQDLTLTLTVDGVAWRVDVSSRGHELGLVVRTAQGDYQWDADEVSESLRRPRAEARVMPAVPWAERCLGQLAKPLTGGGLSDARAALALVDSIEQALERRLPPSRVPIVDRQLGVAALGLEGELPVVAPLAPTAPPVPELPLEATAYMLGLRPATYLRVEPQDADRIAARLPGFVERRDRRVGTPGSGALDDSPGRGEPRVDLHAAPDADVARRIADYRELASDTHISEVGALLGYPACCVQAYLTQGDRSDASFNRYAIAARTSIGPGPWPRWLDDTSLKLLPHLTCTYRCERSLEQIDALIEALAVEQPELRQSLADYLGGPVLYFDEDHQLRFDGESTDPMAIRFQGVSMPSSPSESFAQLAASVALGDRLVLTDATLTVYLGDELVFTLERSDPGLGVILPFAARTKAE